MNFWNSILNLALLTCLFLTAPSVAQTDKPTADDLIKRAANRVAKETLFDLKYKFEQGQVVNWQTEHTESRKTQIAGTAEESSSRSQATTEWEVTNVDSLENMTFIYRIKRCNMWQQTGEEEPITYNSEGNETPPILYENFADNVGTDAATMTIDPRGRIVNENRHIKQVKFGIGSLCIAFPDRAIPVGHQWFTPGSLSAKDEHGMVKQLATRVHYTLTKVREGNAYISFRTEILTPNDSPKVRSKIMQQMTRGYAVFNIKRGLIVHREVDWDEKVQEFEGVGSYLKYLGKYTEHWAQPESEAKKRKVATAQALEIKPIDGKPIMRR